MLIDSDESRDASVCTSLDVDVSSLFCFVAVIRKALHTVEFVTRNLKTWIV